MNERITESIVRDKLKKLGYYDDKKIIIEEQQSKILRIDKCLKNASKSGMGKGKPEYIISFTDNPDFLIVIECKADITKHESKDRKQYKDYAVDGVLLYASHLSKEFNVIAIAVSGQSEKEIKISHFIQLKGAYTERDIQDKLFLDSFSYQELLKEKSKPLQHDELIKKSITLNKTLNSYSISERNRCTLVSCILTSLQDPTFKDIFHTYEHNRDLASDMISACKRVLKKNGIEDDRQEVILQEYNWIKTHIDFASNTIKKKKSKIEERNTVLKDLINDLKDNVLPFIKENDFDILGQFYTEFIRYAGNDSKTGLVLTPRHITELFCEIVNLQYHDIVFDPCCGTGGFLVSAMKWMMNQSGNDQNEYKKIKSERIIGIEKRADMFTHSCSNMMMRGDGKSHIYNDDCFREEIKLIIKRKDGNKEEGKSPKLKNQPNVSFLNPPYDGGEADQLNFVENALDCISKRGKCVAICQMSTVVSSKKQVIEFRRRLLENHTLEAVFSMPDDLFHPIGVVTCILVFTAHIPHPQEYKSYFGYWKNDGFVKRKSKGRIDGGRWSEIKNNWLSCYKNKESVPGLSVVHSVSATDEWCAEAYMETDYSTLTESDFIETVREFVAFKFLNEENFSEKN